MNPCIPSVEKMVCFPKTIQLAMWVFIRYLAPKQNTTLPETNIFAPENSHDWSRCTSWIGVSSYLFSTFCCYGFKGTQKNIETRRVWTQGTMSSFFFRRSSASLSASYLESCWKDFPDPWIRNGSWKLSSFCFRWSPKNFGETFLISRGTKLIAKKKHLNNSAFGKDGSKKPPQALPPI